LQGAEELLEVDDRVRDLVQTRKHSGVFRMTMRVSPIRLSALPTSTS